MSQIEELQRRITAAMERISVGVDVLSEKSPASGGEDSALREALDEEKLANAQLEERLRALKERHEAEIDTLRQENATNGDSAALRSEIEELRASSVDASVVEDLRSQLAEASSKLATVEAARAELAAAKSALEDQNEASALKAEIEALRDQLDAVEDVEPLKAELETLRQQAGNSEELDRLRAENNRLTSELADSERIEELSAELEMLRAERASHGTAMSRLDGDLQRLRKANEQLRTSVEELRAAAADGLSDANLLNRATAAELEATRAARATDAAEAHAVLARLEPLLARANLTEGEVE